MADGIVATLDNRDALVAALTALGDAALPFLLLACEVSANNIQREMQSRVRRATGTTAEGIVVLPDRAGQGYIVEAENADVPELPLFLEKGTKGPRKDYGHGGGGPMPAFPFFYISAILEEGPHEQRIAVALQAAIDAQGLGDS